MACSFPGILLVAMCPLDPDPQRAHRIFRPQGLGQVSSARQAPAHPQGWAVHRLPLPCCARRRRCRVKGLASKPAQARAGARAFATRLSRACAGFVPLDAVPESGAPRRDVARRPFGAQSAPCPATTCRSDSLRDLNRPLVIRKTSRINGLPGFLRASQAVSGAAHAPARRAAFAQHALIKRRAAALSRTHASDTPLRHGFAARRAHRPRCGVLLPLTARGCKGKPA